MKGRTITAKATAEFREHLILKEKSTVTVEKYIRDVKAFWAYMQSADITKETIAVIPFLNYNRYTPVCFLFYYRAPCAAYIKPNIIPCSLR